jgi:hypothetical protein
LLSVGKYTQTPTPLTRKASRQGCPGANRVDVGGHKV